MIIAKERRLLLRFKEFILIKYFRNSTGLRKPFLLRTVQTTQKKSGMPFFVYEQPSSGGDDDLVC